MLGKQSRLYIVPEQAVKCFELLKKNNFKMKQKKKNGNCMLYCYFYFPDQREKKKAHNNNKIYGLGGNA